MTPDVSSAPILDLVNGFRAARFLMAATELGLFEALADSPATIDELAARTHLTRRAARICADAMVAVALLDRDGDIYANSAAAAAYLAGTSPADLRPFLRFSGQISYPAWINLVDALRHGPTSQITDLDPGRQKVFSEGVEALNAGTAAALADTVDFGAHHRLLDIGGGTGSWSIAVARTSPHLTATVFELPQVVDLARQRIAEQGLTERIDVVAGDVRTADLPTGHDCCLLANVIHCFSPEDNRRLLAAARRAVLPGARLLLADYWTDPTHTEPVVAALMAGEYAVNIADGDVYSLAEGREWLTDTGWRFVAHEQLAGAKSVIIAEAV
ncbi:hydroxyindole O-methyltransferase [Longispora fulva]|uniref:SAM-dependent methyltransferase n=1 Tax=Longispora fulva TaxID=619741 RepID=A0A8J7GNP7_9ACTN|nr:methyltransferase [Longispora fulva]MBG6141881.1 SAM-dependent methyltransferase [Longispora fulva]GIG58963.1 hydroxyindole O-methyltransferase [Longispora fulva]